jgi:hypothetical protein
VFAIWKNNLLEYASYYKIGETDANNLYVMTLQKIVEIRSNFDLSFVEDISHIFQCDRVHYDQQGIPSIDMVVAQERNFKTLGVLMFDRGQQTLRLVNHATSLDRNVLLMGISSKEDRKFLGKVLYTTIQSYPHKETPKK